jgi:hypothetical protein
MVGRAVAAGAVCPQQHEEPVDDVPGAVEGVRGRAGCSHDWQFLCTSWVTLRSNVPIATDYAQAEAGFGGADAARVVGPLRVPMLFTFF